MNYKLPKNASIYALPLLALLILAGSYFRIFDNYELQTLDYRFKMRPAISVTDKIAIIEIDDDSIKKIGQFPIGRTYHAAIVKALSDAGAKAIVFDMFFSEPRDDDPELEEAIKKAGNVYLPYVFDIDQKRSHEIPEASGYVAKELETFSAIAAGAGHINIIPDIDGKYRRIPPFIKYKDILYPYLPFKIVCDYLDTEDKNIIFVPGKYVQIGQDIHIPLDDRSNIIVNFAGKWGKRYKHYSYVGILQSYFAKLSGIKIEPDTSLLKDKVCVIGLTAVGTSDLHPNPFESLYPAVGIYADIFNSVINKNFITRASRWTNISIILILSALAAFLTFITRPVKGILILFVLLIVFIVLSFVIFDIRGLWIDTAYPVIVTILVYLSVTLYKYISEWKKRLLMENELEIAKKIQESFLPKRLPATPDLEFNVRMFTARQVGGDLYDFLEFDSSKIGVMIGDVSGKGIPASLFMAMVTSEFKFFAKPESDPRDVLSSLNSKLTRESSSNLFVTMFYMIFDMKEKTVSFSNGGHLPVIHSNRYGKTALLDVPDGTPLGLLDSQYGSRKITFEKSDFFVLYTDGVTEAMNGKKELYGEDRLLSVIKKNTYAGSKELLDAIVKDIRSFEPITRQHDDMTIIVVKIKN